MGTNDRDGKFQGGSLVDGLKRRVPVTQPEIQPLKEPERKATIDRVSAYPESLAAPEDEYGFENDDYGFSAASVRPPTRTAAEKRARLRTLGVAPYPPKTEPTMLGFKFEPRDGRWIGETTRPFKPKGLFIVQNGGLPFNANVDHIYVGMNSCVLLSHVGVPAHFFTTAKSYEQIAKEIEAGGQPLPAWGDYPIAHPGVRIHIKVSVPDTGRDIGPDLINLGMWGLMIP